MAANQIFGIDLGTTYSCISYVDESGRPVVVPNADSQITTPSVVFFENANNFVVGIEAKNTSKLEPDRVVECVKRDMGNPSYFFEVDGKQYKPEEISSIILRKLVNDAAQTVGHEIKDVVITCPAYFGINEREATKNAGELAGLTVHHILNEPTAAAICYGIDRAKDDQTVLVYDLGGGTFDVTVIALKNSDIHVVVTGGNKTLGGKDWDDRLTEYLASEFSKAHPEKGSPLDDRYSYQDLLKSAEDLKKALTAKEKTGVAVSHAGERVTVQMTREEFENLTADLVSQTIDLTRDLLRKASERGQSKIDRVLLVGGSSKMPVIARRMKEEFGFETELFEPDLSVAKGAALMGVKILAGELIKEVIAGEQGVDKAQIDLEKVDDGTLERAAVEASKAGHLRLGSKEMADLARSKIINVSSKSLGIAATDHESREEFVAFLIHSNTPVPAELTQTDFGTLEPNQQAVTIRVMEQGGHGESPQLSDNVEIGEGEITGLPPNLPAGTPIHVTFRLEEDGTLRVRAVEPSSMKELKLEVRVEGFMSREEVLEKKGLLLTKTVS
ncbi:MAG TPA: Hsp70 family protein [Pyrinomonadaceae bacterium]|nr:Hsp70 family protein [Pyrinomonadaceae bacterium]